jgi:hypothetical protein
MRAWRYEARENVWLRIASIPPTRARAWNPVSRARMLGARMGMLFVAIK